jgi:glycosyltransferase involved in cell wall biosynthesis
MKVVQIYNQQRSIGGGEENVVLQTTEWLRESGIETDLLLRSSRGIGNSFVNKAKAAITGTYNSEAYRFMRDYIAKNHPSVVHAHNLYPQWSPSVLMACRDEGVPTLFTVHCQILTCPTWYHLYKGQICEKCLTSGEQWCVLKNCRDNYAESMVYALRSFIVRKNRWFHDNVNEFITPSGFMRDKLLLAGFSAERIRTIWNAVPIPEHPAEPLTGKYVAFAGRLSAEKGVDILLEAARMLPNIPFRLAGTGPLEPSLRRQAPPNVTFLGFLSGERLASFYQGARIFVSPSICYETFSIVAAEGMAFGLPVVASQIGALPELISEGVTGHLIEAGDIAALAAVIDELWNDPQRCKEMGLAGREWVKANLTKATYISKLLKAYRDVQEPNNLRSKNNHG